MTDSEKLAHRYRRDGFVHIEGFCSPEEVGRLRTAIEDAPERDPEPNPLTLDSMRFASNLLYGSPVLQEFLGSDRVVALASTLRGPDLWVRWDQAVWKGPGAPAFPWHQDNGYTELGAEHLQMWIALTPMRADNGGLAVWPRGHRRLLNHRWIGNHVVTDPEEIEGSAAVDVTAQAGDLVVFSSFLPHTTHPNTTDEIRLAYVAEFLPLSEPDRTVRPPHFIACRHGRPEPSFCDLSSEWAGG